MKNYKLILSAALILAAACSKENPQDTPVLPDGGKKVNITLSAGSAETKTYVSDPATGVIFWEAEDALGVFTDKDLTAPVKFELASGEGTASANFNGEITEGATEVYVFYPYDENATFDLATKTITASIPATQQMGEQNVVHGAMLAMGIAAYDAESGTYGVTLHNAFSYLKIKIETEDVREIHLGSGSVPFAGAAAFTLSESSVSVASAAGSVNTVTVKAPEAGFTKDSYYYIPVLPANIPAGEFSVYMTSDENGDWMAERISKSAMNFQLGKGLKFDSFDSIAEWFFNIRDYESLERFRTLIKDGEFPEGGLAKFTRDIDLSGKTLAAASGTFNGTLDGQNFSILNWTSEGTGLFDKAGDGKDALIENFTLAGSCSLTPVVNTNFGWIVGTLGNKGIIDGITVNAAVQPLDVPTLAGTRIGMICGVSYGVIRDCINNADVSVTTAGATGNPYIGGIVGYFNSGDKVALSNCQNHGDITYQANCKSGNVYIGGITAGTSTTPLPDGETGNAIAFATSSKGTIDLCINTGNISYTTTNGGSLDDNAGTAAGGNYCNIGGVAGYVEGSITNCTNGVEGDASKGSVTMICPTSESAACMSRPAVGGVAAFVQRDITSCNNYGKVYVKGTFAGGGLANAGSGIQANPSFGGIVAQAGPDADGGSCAISGCNNYGDLEFNGWMATGNGTGMYYGGIIGWANLKVSGCTNEGALTVNSKAASTYAGGVFAQGQFAAENLINRGAVTVTLMRTAGGNQSAGTYHRIGGVVGYSTPSLSGSTNYGKISVTGPSAAGMYCPLVGGVSGQAGGAFTTSNNEGDIEVNFPTDGTNGIRVGGVIGHLGSITVTGVSNKGQITVTGGTLANNLVVGGVIGWKAGGATLTDLTNEGKKPIAITVGDMNAQFFVGGVVGRTENTTAKTWSGLKNYNPISMSLNATTQKNFSYIGGVAANDKTGQTLSSNENYGDITFSGPYKMRIGGISPYTDRATTSCKAECDITASCTGENFSEIGGIIGYTAATGFTGDSFIGDINTSGSTAKVYTGGLLGKSNGNTAFNGCTFGGNLTGASGNNVPGLYVGGLQANNKEMTFGASNKCVVKAGSTVNGTAVTALDKDILVSQSSDGGTFTSTATLTNIAIE